MHDSTKPLDHILHYWHLCARMCCHPGRHHHHHRRRRRRRRRRRHHHQFYLHKDGVTTGTNQNIYNYFYYFVAVHQSRLSKTCWHLLKELHFMDFSLAWLNTVELMIVLVSGYWMGHSPSRGYPQH